MDISFAWMHAPTINHALKGEVVITLHLYYSYISLVTQCYKQARNFSAESTNYGKYRWKARDTVKYIPNNHLHTEKLSGHYISFVAKCHLLDSVINKYGADQTQRRTRARVCICLC